MMHVKFPRLVAAVPFFLVIISTIFLERVGAAVIEQYFTDLEDYENPDWFTLKRTLEVGTNSYGPAYGSTIQVNHDEVNVGLYSYRDSIRPLALHSVTNSYVNEDNLGTMSRWFQEDGNTQIFRLFPGDDTIRNARVNAPRSEAFSPQSWRRGDGWYEFSGRYTFLKVRPGAVLQIKHNTTYWSMQLILDENPDGTYDLFYVKLRSPSSKTILMEDVVGKGVDIKVLDDGTNHKVFVNGEIRVENTMTDRPDEDDNRARWGLYSPLAAMDRQILIFVTGVYVGPEGGVPEPPKGFWHRYYSWAFDVRAPPPSGQDLNKMEEVLQTELDAEPDAKVVSEFYADKANEGNGYL